MQSTPKEIQSSFVKLQYDHNPFHGTQAHIKFGYLILLWNRPWQIPTINTGLSRETAIVDGEVRLAAKPGMMNAVKLNCSQALAFGYFEALLNSTDRDAVARESARLKSYNNLLNVVGYDPDLYSDFVQETFDLLEVIAANVGSTDGEEKLVASFNDDGTSSSIITHFRVKTDPEPLSQPCLVGWRSLQS